MIVIRGRDAREMARGELDDFVARHDGVTIDLGAGDGKWAYRHAQAHPRQLVIAIEPVRESVRETSTKAVKKPERGGLSNVLFVQGAVESLPDELRGVADEVYVTLPWGSLMRGFILAEEQVLAAIASLMREGATAQVVLNTRIFEDPVPIEARDLPEVTPEYMQSLAAAFASAGLLFEETLWMDADEVAALGTTWAKRLSHRAPPRSVEVRLRRVVSAEL